MALCKRSGDVAEDVYGVEKAVEFSPRWSCRVVIAVIFFPPLNADVLKMTLEWLLSRRWEWRPMINISK